MIMRLRHWWQTRQQRRHTRRALQEWVRELEHYDLQPLLLISTSRDPMGSLFGFGVSPVATEDRLDAGLTLARETLMDSTAGAITIQ